MNQNSFSTPQKKTRRALRENHFKFTRSQIIALCIPLAFVLGLYAGFMLWGRPSAVSTPAANQAGADPAAAAQSAAAQTPQKTTRYKVDDGGNPALGPNNAPITIIEFSDYQCPYCRQWYSEVYQRLLQTYPDKIRFVYRDFPLSSIHPEAEAAAEAADCAGEQGRYYDFHDKLFSGEVELSSAAYTQYAQELGLDQVKFKDCVSSQRFKNEVTADYQSAANLGVRSTPTFFINGIPLIGAQPFEAFQEVIDKELSGTLP
jgi:protein-disulfide isomerase